MRRRELLLLLGGALTEERSLRAQQKAVPVIGYLSAGSPDPSAQSLTAFRQGLGETGYVEGQNVAIGRPPCVRGHAFLSPLGDNARANAPFRLTGAARQ